MTRPAAGWHATPALSTALGAGALLLVLAMTLNRQDLLVLALPLVVGTLASLLTRAYRVPTLTVQAAATTLLEGESTDLIETIRGADAVDLVRVQVPIEGWLEFADGGGDFSIDLRGDAPREVRHRLTSTRWGRAFLSRPTVTATTALGLLRAEAVLPAQVTISTIPLRDGFTATELVPGAIGIVGGHRSRRTGEGVDLAGVRRFAAGDRLRRINWPVSSRTGQLHVTDTYSDRDTEVALVLDAGVEIGISNGLAGSSSNLDIAVRAAASIGEHYLRHGDRVGLLNLARPGRPVRSRAGNAQLVRLVEDLLDVKAGPITEQAMGRALAAISDRALIIVLTPLLDDDLASHVASLSRSGRSVILVDTLPAELVLPDRGEWTELAWRIQLLHRQNLSSSLAEWGVPVVPWLGSGSLDDVLARLSRMSSAPRIRR